MNSLNAWPAFDVATYLDAPDVLPAGKLCLEFANTVEWHAASEPQETLASYAALVDWAKRVGIRAEEPANDLKSQATAHPTLAHQIYSWAIELREAIYRIFVAIAERTPPAAADLAILNEALPHAYTMPEVIGADNNFGWRWRGDENGLDGILWPIVRSAAHLLTEGDHDRIGQCADRPRLRLPFL